VLCFVVCLSVWYAFDNTLKKLPIAYRLSPRPDSESFVKLVCLSVRLSPQRVPCEWNVSGRKGCFFENTLKMVFITSACTKWDGHSAYGPYFGKSSRNLWLLSCSRHIHSFAGASHPGICDYCAAASAHTCIVTEPPHALKAYACTSRPGNSKLS
jgi:hypothetical protein